ncbi:hypothetical protein G9A89_015216 [Geosiphon pyriformis]|nr:hypothetical protein G9A89_015216 [Geosiphon pyriformis]
MLEFGFISVDFYQKEMENFVIIHRRREIRFKSLLNLSIIMIFLIFTLLNETIVDASPASLLCLVNKERARWWRQPLALDNRLNKAAQLHTKFMAETHNLTHSDPAGDLGKRIDDQGFLNWWTAGENIAAGFEKNDDVGVMYAWMHSSGHRANILNREYTHFGSGFQDKYWTQNFAQDSDGRPPNVPKCPSDDDGLDGHVADQDVKETKITISVWKVVNRLLGF